jgi:putative membrane protein
MVPGAAGTAAPGATAGRAAQQFPMEAMHSDTFEIQSSRTALQRSRNSEVRTYARQMIADHGRSTAMLRQMAGETTASTGAASRNARIDPRRAQMLQQLRGQRGAAFDRLYAQMQVQAHQEAVQLFTAYAQSGSDPTMRNFATQNLPTLQQHLANAQRLEQAVARSANNRS